MRARRRDDAARSPDEQRVVERVAKPAQCLADGRLAHAELLCRAADAQLVVQRDGDRQEIEVGSFRGQTSLLCRFWS